MGEDVLAWGGSINTQDTFIPRHHHLKFRINAPSKALFCALWLTILNYGLVVNIGAGMMPAWKDNPNVMPYAGNLWAYLKARADGALLPGRPEKDSFL